MHAVTGIVPVAQKVSIQEATVVARGKQGLLCSSTRYFDMFNGPASNIAMWWTGGYELLLSAMNEHLAVDNGRNK